MDQVQQTLRRRGYAGLDVDFEFLPGQLAAAYAAFLARLRRLLNSQGFFLWAALAPKTSARQAGLLYEGHDYAAVGAAVDGVLLMTYEWGYTAGPPMAVSPLPNVRTVLDYAVTEIPPGKIQLGIPNYGPCPLSRASPGRPPSPISGPSSWPLNMMWPSSTMRRPRPPSFTTPQQTAQFTKSGLKTPAVFPPVCP